VKLTVAWIGKTKEPSIQALTDEYLKRLSRFVDAAGISVKNEDALSERFGRVAERRDKSTLVVLDGRGKQLSSEELAKFLGDYQMSNARPLIFAVGPADGFCDETRAAAHMVLSLGRMTMAHELARVVLLEQLYRAFCILKGHPYHAGH
jgi:23S rRNA (pseudouridine1915-N3)-methyltransferase